jgi:hypothetical protein
MQSLVVSHRKRNRHTGIEQCNTQNHSEVLKKPTYLLLQSSSNRATALLNTSGHTGCSEQALLCSHVQSSTLLAPTLAVNVLSGHVVQGSLASALSCEL